MRPSKAAALFSMANRVHASIDESRLSLELQLLYVSVCIVRPTVYIVASR